MSVNDKGQSSELRQISIRDKDAANTDFVLEKNIFSNIFEKDIKRVYIYKKAERLAKAIHLITPAFASAPSLRDKTHSIAIGLVDAAILPPFEARNQMSRELLALSSVLAIARSSGTLSQMNADLISREARNLLQEIAAYEEPRLFLDESPSLADIAKNLPKQDSSRRVATAPTHKGQDKGHISDKSKTSDRREAILSVVRGKGEVYIKDISTVVRGVSEKTIQRELHVLIKEGVLKKEGERRWTLYSLA